MRQLGINEETAKAAVDEVFGDMDEAALLDEAIDRRLRGKTRRDLDAKAIARIVRGLVAQGFEAGRVYARLRGTASAAATTTAVDPEEAESDE